MATPASDLCRAEVAKHRARFPDVSHLEPEQLSAMLAAGPVTLIDVRSPEEMAISTLPQAMPIARMPNPPPPDAPLVVFCTVGYRSSLEARRLASAAPAAGVHSMAGILAWAHAGGEVIDSSTDQPTRRIHAFGPQWAPMVPSGYEAVTYTTLSVPFVKVLLRVPMLWLLAIAARMRWPSDSATASSSGRGETHTRRE